MIKYLIARTIENERTWGLPGMYIMAIINARAAKVKRHILAIYFSV